jgi:hypothetical protein
VDIHCFYVLIFLCRRVDLGFIVEAGCTKSFFDGKPHKKRGWNAQDADSLSADSPKVGIKIVNVDARVFQRL